MPNKLLFGGWAKPAVAKTANFTVNPRDCGRIFTNRGATGTVTATLPKPNGLNGFWCEFVRLAAQSFVITMPTALLDTLVTSADAASDSVTITTIGHGVRIWCDGTQWYAQLLPGAAGTIISGTTVATA
jgi:hypothetical protein